jgi:IS1 family transposase
MKYLKLRSFDELQTFIGSKKTRIWLWTAVNKHVPGVIAWVLGDRSSETFKVLWQIISCCNSYSQVQMVTQFILVLSVMKIILSVKLT